MKPISDVNSRTITNYSEWMISYPAQCILIAEAVIWGKGVTHAVDKNSKDELENLR